MKNIFLIWVIWALSATFYSFQYMLRVLPNLMMNDILQKFHIDASIFGQYSGLYYIGYALAHLPLGFALDRFGTKKVLPICVLVAISGLIPLVFSEHWLYPCIGRVLLGIGSSGAILGLFKIIFYCFGKARFTRMLGISVAIGLCGAIFGGVPIGTLIGLFGWEPVVNAAIGVGVLLAVMLYFILPQNDSPTVDINQKPNSILADINIFARNYKFFIMCMLAGLMVGPLEGFADVWGSAYFRESYGLSKPMAEGMPSFIFSGMLLGSPALSYICDRQGKYFEVVIICALVMGAGFVLMLSGVLPLYGLSVNMLMIGIFCAYQIPVIYKISTYMPARLMGISTAFINMMIMSFGYLFHSVIGRLMSFNASVIYQDGVSVYTSRDFIHSLSIIPIAQFVAAIGFTVILWTEKDKLKFRSNSYEAVRQT